MSLFQEIIEWSESLLNYGGVGLFIVAFIESSFFPLPPDFLLIPLALAQPEFAIFYALLATIGSALGALFGYYIGLKGGRPVFIKIAGRKRAKKVEKYFRKYGIWTVGIAGFTLAPFKLFTIAAGVFKDDIGKFFLISFFSRGARFILEASLIMFFGKKMVSFMDNYFEIFLFILIFVLILGYLFYKKFIQSKF